MTRLRPSLVLALVVVVLAATLTLLTMRRDDVAVAGPARPGAGGTVPVSSSALVCPDVSAVGDTSTTDLTVVSPPLEVLTGGADVAEPAASGSEATASPLDVDAAPLTTLDAQGPAATASVTDTDVGPVAVRTVGDLAPGLSATQVTAVGAGDVSGVAGAACVEPGTESWFVGLGTELGHRPRLTLVNIEPAVAELDVFLYGPTGPLDLAALRDIAVPSGGSSTFELDAVAPDLAELAVEVRLRSGRVAAAVQDSYVDGLTSLGLDWAPATEPGQRVVIPVAGGAGARLLQVVAPGELDTRVAVRLLTATGAIVPVGLEEIELTAGAVRSVDLTGVLDGAVAAIELSGDVPLVAGVRVAGPGDAQRDLAYAGAAAPLAGSAVLAGVRAGNEWSGRLLLTADDGGAEVAAAGGTPTPSPPPSPSTTVTASASPTAVVAAQPPARVRVTYLDAESGAELGSVESEIEAGSTVDLPLTVPDVEMPERFSVVVTPLDGAVYGSWRLDRVGHADAGFTVLPLWSPRLEVEVPYVRNDLSTGLHAG